MNKYFKTIYNPNVFYKKQDKLKNILNLSGMDIVR